MQMTEPVGAQINKIGEEHCLAQKLQQQFLETIHLPWSTMPKMEAVVVAPLLAHHSRRSRMNNIDEDVHSALRVIINGTTALARHRQRTKNMVNETVPRKGR